MFLGISFYVPEQLHLRGWFYILLLCPRHRLAIVPTALKARSLALREKQALFFPPSIAPALKKRMPLALTPRLVKEKENTRNSRKLDRSIFYLHF